MANLWQDAVPVTAVSLPEASATAASSACAKYFVPAGTLVYYDLTQTQTVSIVIASSGSYMPDCADGLSDLDSEVTAIDTASQVYYGSVIPVACAVSISTVVAWLLLILLFIAKKRRPWFQKFMTLLVATSLTVFLSHTTRILEQQYDLGYLDARELRIRVFGSLAFRILEVIFLLVVWLAHLQVLVRLYESPKERLLIKSIGVALAAINTIMWSLVNFLVPYHTGNHTLEVAIPVVADVLQITLQVTYAGLVVFYSIRKRRFAYHPQSLVIASISLLVILTPLAFFILGIAAHKKITGWSEFLRWVSDAAASVVVWEWVDVIERLQKEEQKAGFLGRQIYDYDDSKRNQIVTSTGLKPTGSNTSGRSVPGGASEPGQDANRTVKRISGRSMFPLFKRSNTWVVSRSVPANTASAIYGNKTEQNGIAPDSRPASDPPPPPPSDAPLIPPTPRDQISHSQSMIPSPLIQEETPSPFVALTPPAPESSVSPINIRTISPSKPTASPLQRHVHPLRRGNKRNNSTGSAGSSINSSNPLPRSNTSPVHAESPLPDINERLVSNLPPILSNLQEAQDNNSNDDEYDYIEIRADGGAFNLDNGDPVRTPEDEQPPSFNPHPGFSTDDYWDDKAHRS